MSINWYKYIFNTTLNINKITVYFRIQANDKALNLINRPKMVYNIFIKSNISLAAWCLPKMLCEIREWMSEWVCGGRKKWLRVTCICARYIVAIDVNIFFLLQLLLLLLFFCRRRHFFCNHINHSRRPADWISPTPFSHSGCNKIENWKPERTSRRKRAVEW